jgi:hypothetical protein
MGGHTEPTHDYPLWAVPVWKMGASFAFPLYKALRQRLGWRPGDMLLVRIHPPYVTFRVALPERIIPIDDFGPEVLPPSWPGKDDNATTPDDSAGPARSAARSNTGSDS